MDASNQTAMWIKGWEFQMIILAEIACSLSDSLLKVALVYPYRLETAV
jgi:hypothetical protein